MKRGGLVIVAVSLIFVHAIGYPQTDEILLSQSAESAALPGSVVPENGMIKAILSSYDRDDLMMHRETLKECMVSKRVPLRALFRAKTLPKIANGDTVYFVRPAAEPFCQAFYGAHIFQFWLVTQNNKVLYSGGADGVTVFKTHHNGIYDIEVEDGGGWGMSQTKMEYDGQKYKPVVCTRTRLDAKGREYTRRVTCS